MTSNRTSIMLFALALAVTVTAVSAQAPDCTGISPVLNNDPDLEGELTSVLVAGGFSRPLQVVSPPGDHERLFVVEQDGRIEIIKNGAVLPDAFLNVASLTRSPSDGGGNEQGLLALAFHPDYNTPGADNEGRFFIFHTNTSGSQEVIARYEVSGDPDEADTATRTIIFGVPSAQSNHNGGTLAFSPNDGYLYLGTGDGGGACDGPGNGQNLNSLNGKLLRFNVDNFDTTGLSTAGNPFDGGTPGLDEIWAYGMRNPWRMSFDRITANLYVGDVGQFVWEEIDCQQASSTGGENYGWDRYEGNACPVSGCTGGSCSIPDYVAPMSQYNQGGALCTIIGGFVYRGCRMPDLHRSYFYADHCVGTFIHSVETDASCSATNDISRAADLAPIGGEIISQITSFGEDEQGELYMVDRLGGEVFKILPILSIMETLGTNATQLLMGESEWTWEDLEASSGHPVSGYKIYRSESGPTGTFDCAERVMTNAWPGGDPDTPSGGQAYYYLVVGQNGAEEGAPGTYSDGSTPRTVNTTSFCL